jgi:hypothetical protein
MPAYTFEALDAQGQTRKGVMEAETVKAARSQLRAQALVPLKVEPRRTRRARPVGPRVRRRASSRRACSTPRSLAIWTRQIAGLITSGLPLERALTALTDEAEDEKQRNLIASLRAEVNAGCQLCPGAGPAPARVLRHLCGGDRRRRAERPSWRRAGTPGRRSGRKPGAQGQAHRAALYPAIVTVIAIAIVIFLVSYVVPQVASVFAGTKRALPFLTVAMLALSAVVRQYGWAILLAIVLIAAGGRDGSPKCPNPGTIRRRLAEPAAGGPPLSAGLQRRTLCLHPGHAGRRGRAHPEGPAGRGRNPVTTAPCAPTRWTPWCWCARARRWPRHWAARSVSPACWPCLPAWASRPASCP